MKTKQLLAALFSALIFVPAFVQAESMDTELSSLAKNLATQVKEHGKKKVTVLDFTDLQGGTSEFGKYIAEQLTVELVTTKQSFSVLDRANLKSILAEHKLTATGLVDPENAKKLGQFAGVDALILGTILPIGSNIQLTAKVITTDTAEIIGAAKSKFASDETAQQLMSHPAADAPANGEKPEKKEPPVVKTFGDLKIELAQPVRIVNGNQLLVTMTITNQGSQNSIWTALSGDGYGNVSAAVTDSNGLEFRYPRGARIAGIQQGVFARYGYRPNTFSPATEIASHDAIAVTIPLVSVNGRLAASGLCKLQLELLVGYDMNAENPTCNVRNLNAELKVK